MIIFNKRGWTIEKRLMGEFLLAQIKYSSFTRKVFLGWILVVKDVFTKLMYRQRGRFSQSFVNVSVAIMFFLAIIFSGQLEDLIMSRGSGETGSNYLIMASDGIVAANTLISDLPKGEVADYRVVEGDTLSLIAQKFGVSLDTIIWENNLKSVNSIKPNQILRILPGTGINYKVARGETIYSIAKKLQINAQNIIDYPFNSFANDETFSLIAGQEIFVPDGIKPKVFTNNNYIARTVAPIPGVVGEGNFMWPTSGYISQKYYWYHRAIDIASKNSPDIVASQGGTVTTAGWNAGGYGNFVIVNHGNGYRTLYAHMLHNSIVVKAGQRVVQGQKLGIMGSTGRSTGTHLHFEVITGSGKVNPLTVLN
jgi:murein DD-endopeptidase MepM/ murein hydrolase activator NlpD